jgi:BAI1-associated protein 3
MTIYGLIRFYTFTESYRGVEQRLQYHKTETEQLISLYHSGRLFEQLSVESTEYGVLSVRAYFHHDSLCVEVLNARDVIPLDPNGKNDKYWSGLSILLRIY